MLSTAAGGKVVKVVKPENPLKLCLLDPSSSQSALPGTRPTPDLSAVLKVPQQGPGPVSVADRPNPQQRRSPAPQMAAYLRNIQAVIWTIQSPPTQVNLECWHRRLSIGRPLDD